MGMLIWILYDIIYKISQKSAEGLIWELEFFFKAETDVFMVILID